MLIFGINRTDMFLPEVDITALLSGENAKHFSL